MIINRLSVYDVGSRWRWNGWPRRWTIMMLACLCCYGFPSGLVAAGLSAMKGLAGTNSLAQPAGPIDAKADRLDYDREAGKVEARGNVVIRNGEDELRADYVRVDLKAETAEAFGNVILKRASGTWTGNRVRYNIKTREADCDQFTLNVAPFRLTGDTSQRIASNNMYHVRNVVATTCTNTLADSHYHVKVREMDAIPGEYFDAYGAAVYLGPVPVMYLPYWYRNLREDVGFRFLPGYASRMGAFLLTDTRYRLNSVLRADTELDYRTKRGVGVGEGFKWTDPDGRWMGDLKTYYISDDEPMDEYDSATSSDIPNDRYRIRLKHTDNLTDRDYILLQANYLSDLDILEDFFEDEYRAGVQPENYGVYTHRGDLYTINALVRARLNDFYSNVNRVPEVSVDFMRQPIVETPLYYEGRTAASFLQKVWEDSATGATDYSLFRFDSSHMVSYPEKYFGFLNVSPRAGYRATFYSKTRDTETTVDTSASATTNWVVDASGQTNATVTTTTATTTNIVEVATGAKLRSRVELGMEVSYKAFATWDADGTPMRHVIEPYANYTFVPEPNLLPENIYQFDEIDQLTKDHSVRLGARNKIQTKRDNMPFNLVDVDAYARFLLEREEDQDFLDSFGAIGELHFVDWMKIRFDGEGSPEDGLTVFNTRVESVDTYLWTGGFEYRFRKDDSSLLLADLTLFPKARWACNAYGRYEMEDSRTEEVGGYLQRNYDCISVRTGVGFLPGYTRTDGIETEDEWRIILGLWLTAFPEGGLIGRYVK